MPMRQTVDGLDNYIIVCPIALIGKPADK